MESVLEILNECLKESNLETVSKAELRKKYLEKTGLRKLSREDKKLFISAVNTAYLNYIANKTTTDDIADETKIDNDSSDETKGSKDWKLTISSSDDDNTPQNVKEKYDQVINRKNNDKKISDHEMRENFKHEKLGTDSTPDEDISPRNIQENDVEMDSSNDFDEKSLATFTNGYKKLSGKRTLISSSEDETIQLKPTKKKKVRKSSDLEMQPATLSEEKKDFATIKNKPHFKKAMVQSSDSEDEPLSVFQKKSNSYECLNSVTKTDDSENKCLSKSKKKQFKNHVDSEDESIRSTSNKSNKCIDYSENSSDSEAEPLMKFQNSNHSSHSNGKRIEFKTKRKSNGSRKSMKLKSSSSDSDEPLTKYKKSNDSIRYNKNANSSSIEKLNSSNKSFISTSESEDEFLAKKFKQDVNNFIDLGEERQINPTEKADSLNTSFKSVKDSSDSEDKPLHRLSNKKDNSIVSKQKPIEKIVKRKVKQSLKKRIVESDDDANISNQKKENSDSCEDEPLSNIKKKHREKLNSSNKFNKSFESTSESEDERLITSTEKADSSNTSFKSMKDSSDSEDKPLHRLSNKKDNSIVSKQKPIEKIVKRKVKQSLKKRIVESDDDANISNQKKENSLRDSPPSDSCEDEPLSSMKKKHREKLNSNKSFESTSESEDELLTKKLKQDVNNFIDLSDERLINSTEKADSSNTSFKSMNDSSDSEDKPLHRLSNKKKDNSHISKKNPVEKIVKRKVKQSLKKRIVESDDDANISNQKKENSVPSDSCEDEPLSNMKKEPNNSSDSEDEPLNKLSAKKSDRNGKSSESCSSSFVDENEEQSIKKNKLSKKKEANDSGKGKKRPSASENKIEHLKKYLRVAGIRITNYNKLFENCKSIKAKCEKMMSLLEKEGLEGRPTLEKCKKLRVKIETKREIAELDVSNILKVKGGRPKRGVCSDTTNCKEEKISSPIKKFSRLQDIVDSEESD